MEAEARQRTGGGGSSEWFQSAQPRSGPPDLKPALVSRWRGKRATLASRCQGQLKEAEQVGYSLWVEEPTRIRLKVQET